MVSKGNGEPCYRQCLWKNVLGVVAPGGGKDIYDVHLQLDVSDLGKYRAIEAFSHVSKVNHIFTALGQTQTKTHLAG